MKIENLTQLKDLIKLCRKLGIDAIEVGEIKIGFGQVPTVQKNARKNTQKHPRATETSDGTADVVDMPDELTSEQLLIWSVGEQQ